MEAAAQPGMQPAVLGEQHHSQAHSIWMSPPGEIQQIKSSNPRLPLAALFPVCNTCFPSSRTYFASLQLNAEMGAGREGS